MSQNKKIKVLMLLPNLKVANGVTSYAMNYFRAVDNNKFQIDFAIYNESEMELFRQEIEAQTSRVFVLPGLLHLKRHITECRRILKENSYDVIHDNSMINTIPMMWCSKKFVSCRILHSHNSKMGETTYKEIRNKLFLPYLKRTANRYAACSQKAGYAMFKNECFTLVPNIISPENYRFSNEKRVNIRKQFEVEEKIVIGTVGRIAVQKNPFFAVEVIHEVVKRCPYVEYWWIGDGPLEEKLMKQINKMGIGDKVKLLGSRNDVGELYQAMDCFFLPSLFEGLPVTGVEAQAYGLPCIMSNSITKEVEYTNLIHYLSLKDSVKKWADKIIEVIQEKRVRRGYYSELSESCFSDSKGQKYLETLYMQEEK